MSRTVDSYGHVIEDGDKPVRAESCGSCYSRDQTASYACDDGATSFMPAANMEPEEILVLIAGLHMVQQHMQRRAQIRHEEELRHATSRT